MKKELYFTLENKNQCYGTLVEWWEKHKAFNGTAIPFESIPNRIFTVCRDGVELYKVAVYSTDSDMCWIGWITSNPHTTMKERYKSLEFLYDKISKYMSSIGFNILVSKTKQTGLMRTLDNTGFDNVEPLTNFYIKQI